MHNAAGVNSIRPDSFLQVSLNVDLCFSCPGTFLLSSSWWSIVTPYSASMQTGADASLWLNGKLHRMLSAHWHSGRPQGLDSLCSVSISNVRRDVLCSEQQHKLYTSEGSVPVNSDISHTVPTKFWKPGGHQRSVSACKLMRIIWPKTNYPNAQCEVDCQFRGNVFVHECVCVFLCAWLCVCFM